jgi:hypothetical protein
VINCFESVYKMYIGLNSCKITCINIIFQDNMNFDTYTSVIITISSNKFDKLHLAVHSFSIEKFTLVFFKLKTLVLVGFVLGNGENCWLSPAATVAPLLKDFVCKKQYLVSYIIIPGLYHSWWDVFSKTVPIAGLTKSLNEMILFF